MVANKVLPFNAVVNHTDVATTISCPVAPDKLSQTRIVGIVFLMFCVGSRIQRKIKHPAFVVLGKIANTGLRSVFALVCDASHGCDETKCYRE